MYCSNCGTQLSTNEVRCHNCGAVQGNQMQVSGNLRPLGAWEYFGYSLLFSIPIVGFILVICFSCSDANINRRNYARSYLCMFVLSIILIILLSLTGALFSVTNNILRNSL